MLKKKQTQVSSSIQQLEHIDLIYLFTKSNYMKQIIAITLVLSIFTLGLQAQSKTESGGISFGIRAGVNLQNINGRDASDNKLENKLVPRISAGINVELPLADDFYVQPGVLYAAKGTKFKGSNVVLNVSYIEVPVYFLYKPTLGSGHLLMGIGPYAAFGLSGKLKPENGNDRSIRFKKEISIGEVISGNYLRGFDAGGNLLFGYELSSKISVQLNAQLGLMNIYPDIDGVTNSNIAYKNTGYGLSLGYRF